MTMPTLGTKKFWKPASGSSVSQQESQILKNSGYINIQLVTVNYMSKGNFWQNTFGGSDNIALATTVTYKSASDSPVEATSVQDVREVKVNNNYQLGISRNIAVKIPANANSIEMAVKIAAVKSDDLQAKFDMLNKPEYQSALQLAPAVVGQVLTITSLVKGLFTDAGEQAQLEATYAGIISAQTEAFPVNAGKLTRGMLILISTTEGDPFSDVDESKFELRGDSLYYDNREVTNTYIIFNISFDPLKGDDENANWFRKYNDALNNLDKLYLADDDDEKKKIYADSKTAWIEGNALLDADVTYINSERMKIKATVLKLISDKYKAGLQGEMTELLRTAVSRKSLDAGDEVVEAALPHTSRLWKGIDTDRQTKEKSSGSAHLSDDSVTDSLVKDAESYLQELASQNLSFRLAETAPPKR